MQDRCFRKKGDLVLIPANVDLYKESSAKIPLYQAAFSKAIITDKPDIAILLETQIDAIYWNKLLIFWRGEYWRVEPDDIFDVPEKFDTT